MGRKPLVMFGVGVILCIALRGLVWTANASDEKGEQALAARVNGKPIFTAELQKNLKLVEKRYEMMKAPLNDENLRKLKKNILDRMIDEILLSEVAKREGITVPDAEVDRVIQRIKLGYRDNKKFKAELKKSGRTLEELKSNIRRGKLIRKLLETKVRIKPQELKKMALQYYKTHPAEFTEEKAYKVSHILIRAGKNANAETRQKARAKAEQILKRLRAGENFAELAKKFSEAPDAKDGGNLGYLIRGRMVPEFEKTAFALKPGQISRVVKTRFGYHIIKVSDIRPARLLPFDKVEKSTERQVKAQLEEKKKQEYISSLRKHAKIELFVR